MPKIDYQYGYFRYFFNYYDSVGFHPFLIIIGENGKLPRSRLLGTPPKPQNPVDKDNF